MVFSRLSTFSRTRIKGEIDLVFSKHRPGTVDDNPARRRQFDRAGDVLDGQLPVLLMVARSGCSRKPRKSAAKTTIRKTVEMRAAFLTYSGAQLPFAKIHPAGISLFLNPRMIVPTMAVDSGWKSRRLAVIFNLKIKTERQKPARLEKNREMKISRKTKIFFFKVQEAGQDVQEIGGQGARKGKNAHDAPGEIVGTQADEGGAEDGSA